MKKALVLTVAATLLLLCAAGAQAADLTARGYWWMEAVNKGGWDFLKDGEDNRFTIEEKLRTAFYFTANENLRGILDTQIGSTTWGSGIYQIGSGRNTGSGGPSATNGGAIMLRKGYIEYKVPGTLINTSVGFQTVTLPAAFGGGNPIFDDQVAAAVVSAPLTKNISLTAGYARPMQGADSPDSSSAFDVVFASLPITGNGINFSPFVAYGYGGADSGAATTAGISNNATSARTGVRAYWGGAALTVKPDMPLVFMADVNYGSATYNNDPSLNANKGGRSGYMLDFAVDYTGLNWVTPEFFATYSSGESSGNNATDGKSNRMPVIGLPQNWTIGSFFFGERLELSGSINNLGGYTRNTLGYWATGISLKNISLMDKLSQDFNLLYARGTNSPDSIRNYNSIGALKTYGGYLTSKDSLVEVDLNSRYKLYDELTGYVYLGYIFANFDKDLWGNSAMSQAGVLRQGGTSNAYKIGVGLNYFF